MKLYFMGICGTAMGNVALLARAAGHTVQGSDAGVYPPMSEVLSAAGIVVHEGYDAARLESLAPDLVIVGNAISRGNPELEWLLDTRQLRYTSLPAWLAEYVLRGRQPVVICGTHGKTTTSALTAFLLREQGSSAPNKPAQLRAVEAVGAAVPVALAAATAHAPFDPGFLIGGVPLDPPVGQHLGGINTPFVIEGDEYDSAIFDKRSKFIHYAPQIAVLGNLEFDHADIFRDLADVQRSFRHLVRLVPRSGWVLLNGDDANLAELGPMPWTQVMRVGLGENCEVRLVDFEEGAAGASFALTWHGQPWGQRIHWSQPGLFNARNAAMAATAAALALAPRATAADLAAAPPALDLRPLARFRGVRRRQELRVDQPMLKVIEDFGHHPTAIAETLRSLRARYPGHTLYAAFEPRSNTARTSVLQAGFIEALALADSVFIGAVAAARVEGQASFDSDRVIAALASRSVRAQTATSNAELLTQMQVELIGASERAAPGRGAKPRLLVFFTSGAFDGIIARFVDLATTTLPQS